VKRNAEVDEVPEQCHHHHHEHCNRRAAAAEGAATSHDAEATADPSLVMLSRGTDGVAATPNYT
jgi:hypothetical protein